MKATITLQELATKLNGNFWSKEGKERVYLDRGYNTKKMKTTTYVEFVNGMFFVNCFIDCPSQSDNWIENQQEDVISNVEREIREVLATEYFYVVNEKGNVVDEINNEKQLAELYVSGGLFLTESSAKSNMKREDFEGEIKRISRDEFEKLEAELISDEKIKQEVKELLIGKSEFEKKNIAFEYFQKTEKESLKNYFLEMFEYYKGIAIDGIQNVSEPVIKKTELGNGIKVSHSRFGLGEIVEEIENDGMKKLRIVFETEGEKLLLERFANLTYL